MVGWDRKRFFFPLISPSTVRAGRWFSFQGYRSLEFYSYLGPIKSLEYILFFLYKGWLWMRTKRILTKQAREKRLSREIHFWIPANPIISSFASWCPKIPKYHEISTNVWNIARGTTDPTRAEGWVHLAKVTSWGHNTSSNTNLDHISSSESWISINKKSQPNISISTKLKIQNLDQT